MTDQDKVQDSEETESASTADAETDSQETQDGEQSDESEDVRYKLNVMGEEKEMTAAELHEYAKKVEPEFTKRSQELAKFKKQDTERKTRAESEAKQTIEEDEVLKNTAPNVKAALQKLIQDGVDKGLKRYDQDLTEKRRDEVFDKKMDALEKEFPGGSGKPKFNRQEVIKSMQEPGNANFDPRSKFMEMKKDDFTDLAVKEALKKQKGGVETERTGSTGPRKPGKKTPKTYREAGSAFLARLKQSE